MFVIDARPAGSGTRKQIKRRGFRTKAEAIDALNDLTTQLDNGLHVEPSRLTVADYFDHWLETLSCHWSADNDDRFVPAQGRQLHQAPPRRHPPAGAQRRGSRSAVCPHAHRRRSERSAAVGPDGAVRALDHREGPVGRGAQVPRPTERGTPRLPSFTDSCAGEGAARVVATGVGRVPRLRRDVGLGPLPAAETGSVHRDATVRAVRPDGGMTSTSTAPRSLSAEP